jgi:UDP-N-acetylglucosamine 4,6-dehydratase
MEYDGMYIVMPQHSWWKGPKVEGRAVPETFSYRSDNNTQWLTKKQLREIVEHEVALQRSTEAGAR